MQLDFNFISRGHCFKLTKLCDGSEDVDVKRTTAKRLPIITFDKKENYGAGVQFTQLWCLRNALGATLPVFA